MTLKAEGKGEKEEDDGEIGQGHPKATSIRH
jgi:hypothetical protein